jgi:hypothetical protein
VLAAFTSVPGETDKTIKVYGNDGSGNEVSGGETIAINAWGTVAEGTWDAGFVGSTSLFSHITRVVKPVTTGYIDLYAVHLDTGDMFKLVRYHPSQTAPQFRRFRINNASRGSVGTQSATADFNTDLGNGPSTTSNGTDGSTSVILAIVRLRYVPLVAADDLLPIHSLQALRFAVMALSAEDKKDFQLAEATWAKAITAMGKRELANTMTKGTPVILDTGRRASLANRMNRRMII